MTIEQIKESINSLSESDYNKLRDYIIKKSDPQKITTIQELIDNHEFNISFSLHKILILISNDYKYIEELNEYKLKKRKYKNLGAKTLMELHMVLKENELLPKDFSLRYI
jgi:hypothetical protein